MCVCLCLCVCVCLKIFSTFKTKAGALQSSKIRKNNKIQLLIEFNVWKFFLSFLFKNCLKMFHSMQNTTDCSDRGGAIVNFLLK